MRILREDDIVAVGDFASERRDILSVLWAVTKGCNFSCHYCSYSRDARLGAFSSKDDLIKAAKALVRFGRPGYQITLYGGEPTYHPSFHDLLDFLINSDAPIELRVFTNGSRRPAFYEQMVTRLEERPIGIIFSLHPEYTKFRNFKKSVEIAVRAGMNVAVNVMFVPSVRERTFAYVEELMDLRARAPFFIEINFPYTIDGLMGEDCTERDLNWINESRRAFQQFPTPVDRKTPAFTRYLTSITVSHGGIREVLRPEASAQLLAKLQTPSYQDFYCCSGSNVLFIEEDGSVRGGVCDASLYLGNAFRDSELTLIQNMGVVCCGAVSCSSIENIPLPKFRYSDEAQICAQQSKDRAKRYFYQAEAERLTS
jgi:MoaA/NifB/PqqE/SkfB family radical SAM enzyme